MQLNLDTVILFVQDIDKLKSFYVDVLQLQVMEEFQPDWLLLKAGQGKVGLHKVGDQYVEEDHKEFRSESNTKIVFEIEEDIHALRAGLLLKQVPLREVKSFEGYDFFTCDGEDPEGNMFQLKQKKPKGDHLQHDAQS